MEDVYIAIIDTKQLKKVGVVVIRSCFFRYLDAAIPEIAEEYLAFGKICGMGYNAATLKDVMESNALLNIAVGPWPHYTDLNEAIEGARLFGSCFGPYFALPMAITLLSFPDDKLRQSWTSILATSFRRVIKGLKDIMYQKNGPVMAFRSELHALRQIPTVPHWSWMSCSRNNQAQRALNQLRWRLWSIISREWTSSRPPVLFSMPIFQMMSWRALTVLRRCRIPKPCQWTMMKRSSLELLSYLQVGWRSRRRRKSWLHNVRHHAFCSEAGATPNGIHLAATRDSTRRALLLLVPSCSKRSHMSRQSTISVLRNCMYKPCLTFKPKISPRNYHHGHRR